MKRTTSLIALTSLSAFMIGCIESSSSVGASGGGAPSHTANSTTGVARAPVAPAGGDSILDAADQEPVGLAAPEADSPADMATLTAPEADPLDNSADDNGGAALAAAMKRKPVEQVEVAPPKLVGGVWELTFDHLKFDMAKGDPFKREMLTQGIEDLVGKKVRIRGYINPFGIFVQTGIRRFVFVRDNMECCFGPGAALYDCIVVDMTPPKTTDFTIRPIAVEGILSIDIMEDPIDGSTMAIYHLDAQSAR